MANKNENPNFEALKQYMVQNLGAKIASGGKEIIKRCHICGDSSDQYKAHMYIGLKNGAIVYNCFKCNSSGLVNGKFFRDIGCFDTDIISLCNTQNATASNNNVNIKNSIRYRKPNIVTRLDQTTSNKLLYLNSRLGLNYSIEDWEKRKVVFNLYDYLNNNYIRNLTRYQDVCNELDSDYIGFLSVDNAYIILRKIDDNPGRYISDRYANYNIYGMVGNEGRHYVIPSDINTLRPINIYIAEGPFDILSIRENLYGNEPNSIFAAIGGKSYVGMMKYFLLNHGFINATFHVFVDNDISNYEIFKINSLANMFRAKVVFHRNTFNGEKDFGVPKNRIMDNIFKPY